MKYPLSEDEIQLRNATKIKKKAIELLPFDKLFIFESFYNQDKKNEALYYLMDNSDITESEKQIIKNWFIR